MKEELLALVKKYWYVGLIVLAALFLLLRRRGASPPLAASVPAPELAQGTPEGTMGDTLSGVAKQLQDAAAATQLREYAFAQQQIDVQSALLGGEAKYQNAINDLLFKKATGTGTKAERSRLKCPSGTYHIDPTTGEPYCRQEQSHGFVGDILKPAFGTALQTWASGGLNLGGVSLPRRNRPGTPPIAPTPGRVLIT